MGCLCAMLLCVSNSSVFNEISHFLPFFFILIPFLASTQGSRIHSHSSFSLFLFCATNCYSAISMQQEPSSASDCHSVPNELGLIYRAVKSQHVGQNDMLFSVIVIG